MMKRFLKKQTVGGQLNHWRSDISGGLDETKADTVKRKSFRSLSLNASFFFVVHLRIKLLY